ncbi:MAG: hypothetical protein HZA91_03670 [Verrucomicrobia bacterium]|nr:hypothetical protein [Verrucomicrobiota bacterium]
MPSTTLDARSRHALGFLLAAQAVVVLLAGLNLAWGGTRTPLPVGEFVRWREIFSLGFATPASVVLQFLALWTLERGRRDATGPLTLFALAACWLGISMGVHEPLSAVRRAAGPRLAESFWFWRQVFSHAVFFAAYTAMSLAMAWSQVRNPLPQPMSRRGFVLCVACGVLLGAGIFFSQLPAKDIRVDLAVMALTLAGIEALRRRRPFARLPLNVTLELAYALSLVALVWAKM